MQLSALKQQQECYNVFKGILRSYDDKLQKCDRLSQLFPVYIPCINNSLDIDLPLDVLEAFY